MNYKTKNCTLLRFGNNFYLGISQAFQFGKPYPVSLCHCRYSSVATVDIVVSECCFTAKMKR